LKSVALPVREIIAGTLKHWAVAGYAHAPFSPKLLMGLCSANTVNVMYGPKLKSVALAVREIIGGS